MIKVRAHVYISGIVQGVNFRYKTKQLADRLGANGWIENLRDGMVEAVFEGEEQAVRELVDYSRHGPSLAKVTDVEVIWATYTGEYSAFEAR